MKAEELAELEQLVECTWNEFIAQDKYNNSTEFLHFKMYELKKQNKELIEENTNLRNTLSCIVSGE